MHRRIMRDIRALAALHLPEWAGISAAIKATGVPTMDGTALPENPRQALKALDSQLAEHRAEQPKLEKAAEEARDAYIKANMPGEDSPEFKATQEAVKARGENSDTIAELDRKKILILESLGESSPKASPTATPDGQAPRRWDSAGLFAGELPSGQNVAEYLSAASGSAGHVGDMRLGEVINRDNFAAEITGTEDMRRGPWVGIIPQLRRRLRIVDLLPVGTMDLNTLFYTKESGAFTAAKGVKEGEAKPESSITFTDAEAVARTLAVYQKIRKQVLADVPALRSIIDSRLRYLIERKLEEEVLAGKGTDPELEGILRTTGLGVVKYDASSAETGTYVAEQVLRAITTVFLADAEADGIVMAPTDWQAALLGKALYEASAGVKGGSGEFVGGGPFENTPTQLWGLPIVVSAAMKEKEVLVGAFGLGAQLFIREGVSVLMSDSDQDDFIKNKLTLLAEMRAALAVYRPAAFCKVWLAKATEEAGN